MKEATPPGVASLHLHAGRKHRVAPSAHGTCSLPDRRAQKWTPPALRRIANLAANDSKCCAASFPACSATGMLTDWVRGICDCGDGNLRQRSAAFRENAPSPQSVTFFCCFVPWAIRLGTQDHKRWNTRLSHRVSAGMALSATTASLLFTPRSITIHEEKS